MTGTMKHLETFLPDCFIFPVYLRALRTSCLRWSDLPDRRLAVSRPRRFGRGRIPPRRPASGILGTAVRRAALCQHDADRRSASAWPVGRAVRPVYSRIPSRTARRRFRGKSGWSLTGCRLLGVRLPQRVCPRRSRSSKARPANASCSISTWHSR